MATKPSESSSSTVCEAEIPKNEESTTLKLKLQKKERKKIQWTEDTVDNEGLFVLTVKLISFSNFDFQD